MRSVRVGLLCVLLLALCVLGGCVPLESSREGEQEGVTPVNVVAKTAPVDVNNVPLVDIPSLYAEDDPSSLVHFYVTVRRGSQADGTDHTLEEVNSVVALQGMLGVEKLKAEVIFQEGDENGPQQGMLGYAATGSNGTIRIRGKTSTLAPQKSYRIDLFDSAGLWRGQRAIALVKHFSDPTRLRNKLYFDLLREVPDTVSLRTQFVQLYVKDETSDPPAESFEDYGLFTFVETPNRRYLRNHGLNRDGNLYKANVFEFFRYEDILVPATDPSYDAELFGSVIESKNGEDHTKLLAMLEDLNDYTIPIEEIVEKHFDLDNMMSFLAFNILVGNADYNSQNFYLYSPVNTSTWYFINWDGDGSFHYASDRILQREGVLPWQHGVTNVWNMVLFNRVLRVEAYRERLTERVEELRLILTEEKIAGLIAEYRKVVDTFTHQMPDTINLSATHEQMEKIYAEMPGDVERAYEYFIQSMQQPMPFFLGDVERSETGSLSFGWDGAYDFQGSLVTYDFEVATDWTFAEETIVHRQTGLLQLHADVDDLPAGEYWWRVVAHNASGNTQISFDFRETASGRHAGVREIRILQNGQVENLQ